MVIAVNSESPSRLEPQIQETRRTQMDQGHSGGNAVRSIKPLKRSVQQQESDEHGGK